MKYDCLVLGAGMVGISTALHLLERGRSVALVDRRGPAEETSYGNAGIIQTEAVTAYTFPRDLGSIVKYALNAHPESRLHYSALPEVASWLFQYWRQGSPAGVERSANGLVPLIRRCLAEHEILLEAAGAQEYLQRTGYLKVYSTAKLHASDAVAQQLLHDQYDVPFEVVDRGRLRELEPHIENVAGGIFLPDPASVTDPGAVGKAYADLFVERGGVFINADARTLDATGGAWQISGDAGHVAARDAVLALGIWSREILSGLGVKIPLIAKRGYHMHYASEGNASLTRPVVEVENGYVLAPMRQGIRLTTGAEFARRTAAPSPLQLGLVEPAAKQLYPLGARIEPEVWMGRRPCFPDMLPMIGKVPGQAGLWANFGHQHLGFTLGPVTGRLLAEVMAGGSPSVDMEPYRVDRF